MSDLLNQLSAFRVAKRKDVAPIFTFRAGGIAVAVCSDVLRRCLDGLEIERAEIKNHQLCIRGFRVSAAGVALNAAYNLRHIDETVPDALIQEECERNGHSKGLTDVPKGYRRDYIRVADRVKRLLRQQQTFENRMAPSESRSLKEARV